MRKGFADNHDQAEYVFHNIIICLKRCNRHITFCVHEFFFYFSLRDFPSFFFKAFLLNFLKLVKLAKEMQGHTKEVVSDAADFILKTFTGIPQQIFDPVQSVFANWLCKCKWNKRNRA